ncbi:MAG: hypothetical protein D6786_10315 [Gammaproteobacteria bacterium]|nr:MAG: hypothetical protein D6786_10315 [Gammaproteobacteria bacterium]
MYSVEKLMAQTRSLAAQYRRATGKTLPVTAELAVHDAIRLLGLRPAPQGAAGHDALEGEGEATRRVLVKGRAIFDPEKGGQRIGQLNLAHEWDRLLLVLMDESYEPEEIWALEREQIEELQERLKGSRRARRGLLSVARARNIGTLRWSRERGLEPDDGLWTHDPG